MRKENTSEVFVIEDIVPLLHSEGATNIKEGLYDLTFVLDGKVYRLSVQNIPTVILEKKVPFPEERPSDFEVAAKRANDRQSAVKVCVNREDDSITMAIAMINPSVDYFSKTFRELIIALDSTEVVIDGLYESAIY